MAALFYNYSGNNIFKNSVGPGAANAEILELNGLVGEDNMAIILQIGATVQDTYQFFLTFDDFIHHYYFGKGLGEFNCSGMILSTCGGALPGLDFLVKALGELRGKVVTCSMGSGIFWGVLTNANIQMASEPETHIVFNLSFAMTAHNLPASAEPKSAC